MILYYTIPYYTTLYYTILYYTILYYTILGSRAHRELIRLKQPGRIIRGAACQPQDASLGNLLWVGFCAKCKSITMLQCYNQYVIREPDPVLQCPSRGTDQRLARHPEEPSLVMSGVAAFSMPAGPLVGAQAGRPFLRALPAPLCCCIASRPAAEAPPLAFSRSESRAALRAGFARSRVSSEKQRIALHVKCSVTLYSVFWWCMVIMLVSTHVCVCVCECLHVFVVFVCLEGPSERPSDLWRGPSYV